MRPAGREGSVVVVMVLVVIVVVAVRHGVVRVLVGVLLSGILAQVAVAVMGVVVILCVQALVSVAIFNYFRTHHSAESHWFTTMLAPVISVIGQIYVVYLAIKNIDFLATGVHWIRYLIVIDALVFLLGVAMAFYYKSNDRAKYETIGRMVHEGL